MIFSGDMEILLYLAIFYTVSGSVIIDRRFENKTYVENSGPNTLACIATCRNSTCRYQWKSSDVKLTGDLTSYTLKIPALQRKTGLYRVLCTVTNVGYGTTGTCTKTIDIQYPPDVTIEEVNNTLLCNANGNPPAITYNGWKHAINGVPIRSLAGSKRLSVPNDYHNRGRYECRVTNGISSTQTASIEITRNAKPMVLTQPKIEQNVSKGDSFHTLIQIYGFPESLETSLYKKDTSHNILSYVNKTVTKDRVSVQFYGTSVLVSGTHLKVTIDEMAEDYFGEYDVLIGNSVGSTTVKVVLTPKGPPDAPFNFSVTEITHNHAVFQLTSGFHNGANQTVVIQYRPDINGSVWSNGSMEDVGMEQNMTVVLTVDGLSPLTNYLFQAYCYNVFDKSLVVEISAMTKEEPTNLALIGGAVGGAIVGLILIGVLVVVVIIVVRRKRRRRKEIPRMLPKLSIPNILNYDRTNNYTPPPSNPGTATPDIYENTGTSAALYKNTDNELYENTHLNNGADVEIVRKESNYANTPLFVGASFKSENEETRKQKEQVIYSNTDEMIGIKEAQATAAITQNGFDKPDGRGYTDQYSQDSNDGQDEDYLDMEVCAPKITDNARKQPERTYSNREAIARHFTAKKKPTKFVQDEFSESSELYMDMDEERRDSDYQAPLPPPPLSHSGPTGDGYVNLRKKGKQPF